MAFLINKSLKTYIDNRIKELFKELMTQRDEINHINGDEDVEGSIKNIQKKIIGNAPADFDSLEEIVGHVSLMKENINAGFESLSKRTIREKVELDDQSSVDIGAFKILPNAIENVEFIAPDGRTINVIHWSLEDDIFTCYNFYEGDLKLQAVYITYVITEAVTIK